MSAMLYILGLGLDPIDHATLEVLQALGDCDRVHVQGASAAQRSFLVRFCASGRALRDARDDEAAARSVAAELKAGKTVAFATLGHPFYWSALASRLVKAAERAGTPWKTFGAVSPMGLALSAAGATLGTNIHGLQAFDHSTLASRPAVINPTWPLVVYFFSKPDRAAFGKALARLRKDYPAAHPVLLCRASGETETVPLSELEGRAGEASPALVCYLAPAARSRSRLGRTDSHAVARPDSGAPAWVKE